MQSHTSDIVQSLSGRDKGCLFLVMREDDQFVYLANGKERRAEKPKRKKRRHIQYMGASDARTQQRLHENGRLTNSELRKALSIWIGESENE